ncbi:MAG: nicotinate (nicotinamide) nucleotide adenylyltransferase [Nitrospira sp.]|nr:nicotinate (nicotinamide) nucleotide adenylyltransferase [Nitrospira sp.]
MKIGLFGGTFNPIHRCHLTIALQVKERLSLDRILFIPTGDPPHKSSASLAEARHRLAMVRGAIEGTPGLMISEVEIHRPTKSYSIETVRTLQDEWGPEADLFFITGLDAFLELPTWREAAVLLRLCHFVVVPRPPSRFAALSSMPLLPPLDPRALAALDRNRDDRLEVAVPDGPGLTLLALPPCEASASEIREKLRKGITPSNLLPASVESYIIRHRLYQEDTDRTGVKG